ncbi:MAG: hypothetical protein IJC13_07185 [Clostridia bacterium]|nr:hypothetical protein [Clostridia bacterium]
MFRSYRHIVDYERITMHILILREKTILQTRCQIHLSSNRLEKALEKLKKTKRKNLNTQRKPLYIKVLTWRATRDTPACAGCVLGDRRDATVPASDFGAENSSMNCFLDAPHPLGLRTPCKI